MSFQKYFELLPKELHEIIQSFLSLEDCVNMSEVSRYLNITWKTLIDNTPNKRLYIFKHIVSSNTQKVEQDQMLIKRIMSPDFVSDFDTIDRDDYYRSVGFLCTLLTHTLFSMKDIIHLTRLFIVIEKSLFLDAKDSILRFYKRVDTHIRKYGIKIWSIETLADVINWIVPQFKGTDGSWLSPHPPVNWRKLVKRDKCVENVHKLAKLLNMGKSAFYLSKGKLYKDAIDYIGFNFSSYDFINLVQFINVEDLINNDIIISIFTMILALDENVPHAINVQLEKAIEVWKGFKTEVKCATFERLLHHAVPRWIQFADFLWNEELSMRPRFDSLATNQIYEILENGYLSRRDTKIFLNWFNKRLSRVFTPALLAKAMDHENYTLANILLRTDEIDINESYMGRTPLQRMLSYPVYDFNIPAYTQTFNALLTHRNFDWTSEKREMMHFFNSIQFNATFLDNFNEEEKFKNTFKLTLSLPEYYCVTLLNPSKKQKVV